MINDQLTAALPGAGQLPAFFLARQPILDHTQQLVAYELLFRAADRASAEVTDDLAATASVIANMSELGIDQVIGTMQGYVNVDAATLHSDFIRFLAPERTVLEILETVKVTPDLVARVSELASAGYVFALDDVVAETADIDALLPLVKIIKIDISAVSEGELHRLSAYFKRAGKLLLAEKVETREQFEQCRTLGFQYYQGYYFARPLVLHGKKLTPSQLALIELMSLIVTDADNVEIERCIKRDASLSLTLLQLVNSAATGLSQRINSLGQAVLILGRRSLQRWLQILLYAGNGRDSQKVSPLMVMAATRGRLLELIAEKLRPHDRAASDIAFTVGIMSLLDTLLEVPMNEILEKLGLGEEIVEALLHRKGFYGDILATAESLERLKDENVKLKPLTARLRLSSADLNALQLSAFEWSRAVTKAAS